MFGSASDIPVHDIRRRALLISTPAERHLFGVEMVAKFMRAAGWDVLVEKGLDPSQCVASVATEWIGVVGVTLSAETGVDEVARIVEKIRRASMNRAVSVMVGGPAFAENPSLIGQGWRGRRRGRRSDSRYPGQEVTAHASRVSVDLGRDATVRGARNRSLQGGGPAAGGARPNFNAIGFKPR